MAASAGAGGAAVAEEPLFLVKVGDMESYEHAPCLCGDMSKTQVLEALVESRAFGGFLVGVSRLLACAVYVNAVEPEPGVAGTFSVAGATTLSTPFPGAAHRYLRIQLPAATGTFSARSCRIAGASFCADVALPRAARPLQARCHLHHASSVVLLDLSAAGTGGLAAAGAGASALLYPAVVLHVSVATCVMRRLRLICATHLPAAAADVLSPPPGHMVCGVDEDVPPRGAPLPPPCWCLHHQAADVLFAFLAIGTSRDFCWRPSIVAADAFSPPPGHLLSRVG